jgi:cysteine desulfurase
MSSERPIYLDYAATTPVDPAVAGVMSECLTLEGDFGNPSSATHVYGRRASARIQRAREQVAALIQADPGQIVLTSGATESNNLAILGVARASASWGRHLVTSRIEHKAVLDPMKRLEKEEFSVTYLTPPPSGRIDAAAVRAALRPDTILVSVMHVNNEIGVIQDVAGIGALCRERGIIFHSDASQAAGKLPIDVRTLPVDLMSFTAHKLYGPKGIGALYVAAVMRGQLQPLTFGGGQERGLRPGTLPTHQIAGFGAAAELAMQAMPTEIPRITALREHLAAGLRVAGGTHENGAGVARVPGILSVSFEGVDGESLVAALTNLAVSTGSACNSAVDAPSYVLRALGRDTQLAQSTLRLTVGRYTTRQEVDRAVSDVLAAVSRLRAQSPAAPVPRLPAPAGTAVLTGEAGGPKREAWVRFQLAVRGGTVQDARFQAQACPDTVRVAAWLTAQLPGRSRDRLVPGGPPSWAEQLCVPVEKLGRLLTVEDALTACLKQWPPERQAGG